MSSRDNVVKRFEQLLTALLSDHDELRLAIRNKRNEATLENGLATQFVLQAAVFWEAFIHDLIIAYVQADPTRAMKSLEDRIKQSVENKFGKGVRRVVKLQPPKRLTRESLCSLLDPNGWNITFDKASAIASRTSQLLPSTSAKRFALNSADSQFFDYVIALRNYLSHYSIGARGCLVAVIFSLSDPENAPLKARLGRVPVYLKSDAAPGVSRARFIVTRMKDIATKL